MSPITGGSTGLAARPLAPPLRVQKEAWRETTRSFARSPESTTAKPA